MGLVRVTISCQKCDFNLKHFNYYLNVKKYCVFFVIKITVFESKGGKKGIHNCYRETDRETDRETNKFLDTIYGGMHIFLSVNFATSLIDSLAGG